MNGGRTSVMDSDMKDLAMVIFIKENTSKGRCMVRVSMSGSQVNTTMASGKKDSKKAMAYGRVYLVTNMSVSGRTINPTALANIPGATVTSMKVSGKLVLDTARETIPSQLETCM